MNTKLNLHNLHFSTAKFAIKELKKITHLRQIFFDTKGQPDLYFAIDKNLNGYLYSDMISGKKSYLFTKMGQLSKSYFLAVFQLSLFEITVLHVLQNQKIDGDVNIGYLQASLDKSMKINKNSVTFKVKDIQKIIEA